MVDPRSDAEARYDAPINVRCNFCERSLVAVDACDAGCDKAGKACGLRPLLALRASAPRQENVAHALLQRVKDELDACADMPLHLDGWLVKAIEDYLGAAPPPEERS